MSELSRRRFLYLSGGAAATATGVGVWAALLREESEKGILVPPSTTLGTASTTTTTTTTTTAPTPPQNPVVVIVQMDGGNDGLNTLVPLDGLYHTARPTIGLPDSNLISLAGRTDFGLHPA